MQVFIGTRRQAHATSLLRLLDARTWFMMFARQQVSHFRVMLDEDFVCFIQHWMVQY